MKITNSCRKLSVIQKYCFDTCRPSIHVAAGKKFLFDFPRFYFFPFFSEGDTSEDTHALWGMSRDWYAQYLLNNGKHKEAFNQFQDAFLISCELFGNTHPQSLVLLNSLGTVCSLMGEEARAVSYFTKAVNVGKKTASENLSTFMVNLGMAKIKQGLHQEANAVCNEALLIARRNQMSEVVEEAQACINLSSV